MDITIGRFRFRPGIFLTLVTVGVVSVMLSLGQWQMDRGHFREALQQEIKARRSLPPVDLGTLPDTLGEYRFQPVNVNGHYDAKRQLLLDNRIVDGVVGYDVLTPFSTDDGRHILVLRGFVRQGSRRDQLPDIRVDESAFKLTGIINDLPATGIRLDDNANQYTHWPAVVQYLDLDALSRQLGYRLMDMVIYLDKDQNGSLIHHLPVLNLNAEKNYGYAFQWYAMATTVCFLYFFLNTQIEQAHPDE